MNKGQIIAGAIALAISTVSSAPAWAQGWTRRPYPPQSAYPGQRTYTELRISPPVGGRVYVYEGHRLLGRFEQPGMMMVATGRSFRVIAMRGDTQVWTGDVTATGAPVTLDWTAPQQQRFRTPIMPPPSTYPAPPSPYEGPQQYAEPPPVYAPGGLVAPPISGYALGSLLREMDAAPSDQDRLDALAYATSRSTFTVPQADWILGRFRSDAYRLAALEQLKNRLIEQEDAPILLERFQGPTARREAQRMLGLGY